MKEKILGWYNKWCYKHKLDSDLFDIESEIDSSITYEENINILEEKLKILVNNGTFLKEQVKRNNEYEIGKPSPHKIAFSKEIIENLKTIFVSADTGEGKTACSYWFLERLKRFKPIYVFRHPKPELITKIGYKNMYSIDELENLQGIVLWIDEPQIVFPKYERRGSIVLNKLLSLARQREVTLILSTSDTRYITASEEFYISTYIIKRIDYQMIKRGSKIKQIINELSTLTPEGYCDNIKKNEFVFYNRKFNELNRKHTFNLPKFWNESYSKPFS